MEEKMKNIQTFCFFGELRPGEGKKGGRKPSFQSVEKGGRPFAAKRYENKLAGGNGANRHFF